MSDVHAGAQVNVNGNAKEGARTVEEQTIVAVDKIVHTGTTGRRNAIGACKDQAHATVECYHIRGSDEAWTTNE
jgi:hypothetical protein